MLKVRHQKHVIRQDNAHVEITLKAQHVITGTVSIQGGKDGAHVPLVDTEAQRHERARYDNGNKATAKNVLPLMKLKRVNILHAHASPDNLVTVVKTGIVSSMMSGRLGLPVTAAMAALVQLVLL